jgi:hypothetical protein
MRNNFKTQGQSSKILFRFFIFDGCVDVKTRVIYINFGINKSQKNVYQSKF